MKIDDFKPRKLSGQNYRTKNIEESKSDTYSESAYESSHENMRRLSSRKNKRKMNSKTSNELRKPLKGDFNLTKGGSVEIPDGKEEKGIIFLK